MNIPVETLEAIFRMIKREWQSRISDQAKAHFHDLQYFRICIAHIATCKWGDQSTTEGIDYDSMVKGLVDLQSDLDLKGKSLSESEINETFCETQAIFNEREPYQVPWVLGHLLLSDIKIPEGEAVNPVFAESFGALCVDLAKRRYEYKFEKALQTYNAAIQDPAHTLEAFENKTPPTLPNPDGYENFDDYWSKMDWSLFENHIRKSHSIGTDIRVHSFFVSDYSVLETYLTCDNRTEDLDLIVHYLLGHRDIIIDIEALKAKKELGIDHDVWMGGLNRLVYSGFIGAKVKWYFVGATTIYSVIGEIVPSGTKIKRKVTPAIRKELLLRAGYKCQVMDCWFCSNKRLTSRQLHIDHLVAFDMCRSARVEPDQNPENLRVLCSKMNRWKSNKGCVSLALRRPLPPPLLTSNEWELLKKTRRKNR